MEAASARRRADIQGLRALAVILVVAFHARLGFVSGGYVGVDVFFVISGFVITGTLLHRREAGGDRHPLRAFYQRRVRRILPALALMTTVTAALSLAFAPVGAIQQSARTGVAASFSVANVYLNARGGGGYFDIGADNNVFLHTWSLSVEEQFYLCFPLLVLVSLAGWWVLRAERGRRRALVVVLAASLGSFGLSVAAMAGAIPSPWGSGRSFAFYAMPLRAWEFGAGALLALWPASRRSMGQRTADLAAIAGVALVVGSAVLYDARTPFPGLSALVPVAGTALLIAAGTGRSTWVSRPLEHPSAVWIGDVSYGWYLWHWPFIVMATASIANETWVAVAAGVVALLPAAGSFRFVERPVRRWPNPRPVAVIALAMTCVLVPAAACVGLDRAWNRVVPHVSGTSLHVDQRQGCGHGIPYGETLPDACTWGGSELGRPVLLVGDSQAGQFSEAFLGAAEREGNAAAIAVNDGCPFVLTDELDVPAGCQDYVRATLDAIADDPPAALVLASEASPFVETDEGVDAYARGLDRALAELDAAGVPVVLIHPIATMPGWDPRTCGMLRLSLDSGYCTNTTTRSAAAARRKAAYEVERAAVAAHPNVVALDPFDRLCPEEECSTQRGEERWWYDDNHISTDASERFVDDLQQSLRRARQR